MRGAPLEDASDAADADAASRPRRSLAIAEAVRARRDERFLLHGVTGSGKTEVYLRAIAETLAVGRQALVLVPEITLTHQIVARLRGALRRRASRCCTASCGPASASRQWQRLRGGATPIAVGARSALFAPLDELGLIVIDEEHDGAYKNEEGFRYHARDLARAARARGRLPARARLRDAGARVALRRRARRAAALSLPQPHRRPAAAGRRDRRPRARARARLARPAR